MVIQSLENIVDLPDMTPPVMIPALEGFFGTDDDDDGDGVGVSDGVVLIDPVAVGVPVESGAAMGSTEINMWEYL